MENNKRWNKKTRLYGTICIAAACLLMAVMCTGCGSRNTAGSGSATGGAVSGIAVSGNVVSGTGASGGVSGAGKADVGRPIEKFLAGRRGTRYTSQNCVYVSDLNDGVYIYPLDGSKEKYYKVGDWSEENGYFGQIYVSDSYLYYCDTCDYWSEDGAVWRVPIIREGNREKIDIDKKQKVVEVHWWGDFYYASDDSVVYTSDDGRLYAYDIDSRKKTAISGKKENDVVQVTDEYGLGQFYDDCLFYRSEDGLFLVHLSDWKKEKIGGKTWISSYWEMGQDFGYLGTPSAVADGGLYYMGENAVCRYDFAKKKTKELFPVEEVAEMISTHWQTDAENSGMDYDIQGIFTSGSRLYLTVRGEQEISGDRKAENGEEEEDGYDYEKFYMVLSVGMDGSGLTYEGGPSEFLKEHAEVYYYSDYDGIECWRVKTGHMTGLLEGGLWIGEFDYYKKDEYGDDMPGRKYMYYNMKDGGAGEVGDKDVKLFQFVRGVTGYSEPVC